MIVLKTEPAQPKQAKLRLRLIVILKLATKNKEVLQVFVSVTQKSVQLDTSDLSAESVQGLPSVDLCAAWFDGSEAS